MAGRNFAGACIVVVTCMLLLQSWPGVWADSYGTTTITNKSQKEVALVALDVDVELGPIKVEVGASVEVPARHYSFQREGHQSVPVPLLGVSLVAIVDGKDAPGTVDVCLAVDVLGVLELGVTLVVGL